MEKVKKTIFMTTSFEGVHCYPSAPEGVEFLRVPHRHIFGVRLEVEVYHDDRELEFILLKRKVNSWFEARQTNSVWQMGAMSCEMVATQLIKFLQKDLEKGNERYFKVTIDEDGENGAVVEVTPTEEEWHTMETEEEVEAKGRASAYLSHLTLNGYQSLAYKNIQCHKSHQEEVMHWAIGLGEEAGEALSVIKHKYYGGGYDVVDLVGELGDTLWHIAALCTTLGLNIEDVALFNLAKLEHRYPSDEFDYERSMNREQLGNEFKDSEAFKVIMDRIAKSGGKQNEGF